MDSKDYLTNRSFCPIPWTGFMYNFDGNVKTCIRSSEPIGNIKDQNIDELLNNANNKDTRQRMLDHQPGKRCFPCYDLEYKENKFDIISDRVFYLRELKEVPLKLYDDVDSFELNKIDIRWTNLCNFGCVYCGPEFSSMLAHERGVTVDTPTKEQTENLKNYIFERVEQLKHVYLAGGEPLLMKQNFELLTLLKEKNPNVNLRINTNLSKVDTRIFNLACEFKNVHWIISAETQDEEYEYIRYGGTWENFLKNLDTISKLNHKFSFNMLHFVLNSMSIFRCIDFFKERGFHNNSFIIGPVLTPDYLNIRQLPDNMLKLVNDELKLRINQSPGFLLENGYRNMLRYIETPIEKNLTETFNQLKILDTRRGVDSSKIFVDLYKENKHGKTI